MKGLHPQFVLLQLSFFELKNCVRLESKDLIGCDIQHPTFTISKIVQSKVANQNKTIRLSCNCRRTSTISHPHRSERPPPHRPLPPARQPTPKAMKPSCSVIGISKDSSLPTNVRSRPSATRCRTRHRPPPPTRRPIPMDGCAPTRSTIRRARSLPTRPLPVR